MRALNLIGERYGRLVVVREADKRRMPNGNTERRYICLCDCGNETNVSVHSLRAGVSRSCGCLRREMVIADHTTHNMSKTRLYRVWRMMRDRCYRKTAKQYKDYGGRGISVCDEWKDDFANFAKWALQNGYAENLTIERVNNNGIYEPGNCKWIPQSEQSRNRRFCHMITFSGKTQILQDWADELGVNRCTVRKSIKKHGDELGIKRLVERKERLGI